MRHIYEHYQRMHHDNIILAYKGSVSEALFDSILQLAESKLEKIEVHTKLKKKVFNILVEILQNVYHHFEEKKQGINDEKSIIFLLYKEDFGYRIISGNHVFNSEVALLSEKIDLINNLTNDQLRTIYREKLSNGQISNKGGAGLGMLDIVRKSGEKIDYNFQKIDDRYAFFSLEIKISA